MEMPTWFAWAFGLVALVASLFYGVKACDILEVSSAGKPWAWKLHQFWLNFLGALVGWAAMWPLVPRVAGCLLEPCAPALTVADVAVFFLAFVGITGFLPVTVVGLVLSVKELVGKLAGLLK